MIPAASFGITLNVHYRPVVCVGARAPLRRRYIYPSGQSIEERSFYDRFTRRWVKLLKGAVAHALESSFGRLR